MIDVETVRKLQEEFGLNGFLLLESVLSKEEVKKYLSVLRRLDQTVTSTVQGSAREPGDPLEVRNAVAKAPELVELVDHQRVLPVIVGLMGHNIHVNTSHAFIRPPFAQGSSLQDQKAIDWHTDVSGASGPVNGRLPWFYTRVGFFFTDQKEPDSGSLKLVPGSHRVSGPPARAKGSADPYGALELAVSAGDAVVFDNRLWHASAPNYGNHARINMYIGYSWRWMRPIDYRSCPSEIVDGADPVRKQLLGEVYTPMGYVFPREEDVPLKEWMKENWLDQISPINH